MVFPGEAANLAAQSDDDTAQGPVMFFNDTVQGTTYRYRCDPATGTVSDKTLWKRWPAADGVPDGMTTDAQGRLWVAHWGGGCVTCHDADTAPAPSPSPSGSPSSTPGDLLDPIAPADPGSPQPGATTPPAVAPVADDGAPVFTQPSAQLGSKSLSFRGLKAISVVTVPRADGTRVTALKLEADRITISGFSLTVRHETGPILTTTADEMTLDGHVAVYVNSLTATLPGGQPLTLGADTPPPAEGLDSLLGVTLGLVGSTADSITYTNTVQQLTE